MEKRYYIVEDVGGIGVIDRLNQDIIVHYPPAIKLEYCSLCRSNSLRNTTVPEASRKACQTLCDRLNEDSMWNKENL